jgi:uncharacterized glyoxalase superfamily protein PhnB
MWAAGRSPRRWAAVKLLQLRLDHVSGADRDECRRGPLIRERALVEALSILGFTSAGVERGPDGTAVHGEVRIGRHRVWLHPVDETDDLLPPARRGSTGGVVIQVADVDRHHESARSAGANILFAPRDQEYGQREYGVRDPEGHLWWIATATRGSAAR